jgi:uncharacterized surface protein with fasciclin (FAS1) repeats
MFKKTLATALLASAAFATAASAMTGTAAERADLANVAVTQGFAAFVAQGDLLDTVGLEGWQGGITYFAPSADALSAYGVNKIERLLEPGNEAELAAFVGAHVVQAPLHSTQFSGSFDRDDNDDTLGFRSVNGGQIIVMDGATLGVNGYDITAANDRDGNAIIHQINGVLGS